MRSLIAWLVSAAALRPPGGRRPKPTAKPFAPDTDALDDFFTQLDPDALVATAPDETAAPAAPAAEWAGGWDAPTVETGDWVADAAPAFVPEGLGGPEWESLEDDAATELALDVLATPRSATERLDDDDDDELVRSSRTTSSGDARRRRRRSGSSARGRTSSASRACGRRRWSSR